MTRATAVRWIIIERGKARRLNLKFLLVVTKVS